jgi:hypothetical protein
LAALHVNCETLSTNEKTCVDNDYCGWCGDRSRCIPGNLNGPLAPCLKNTFIYKIKSTKWSPLTAGTVNINVGDAIKVIPK